MDLGERIFLGLGSNVGDREHYLFSAARMLAEDAVNLSVFSSIYETPPFGKEDQEIFLNWVLEVRSVHPPSRLLHKIQDIEKRLGRRTRERWGAREIDIDILFYGERSVDTAELIIPHPGTTKRLFVVEPLYEIDSGFIHPVHKTPVFVIRKELKEAQPDWCGKIVVPREDISLY